MCSAMLSLLALSLWFVQKRTKATWAADCSCLAKHDGWNDANDDTANLLHADAGADAL